MIHLIRKSRCRNVQLLTSDKYNIERLVSLYFISLLNFKIICDNLDSGPAVV